MNFTFQSALLEAANSGHDEAVQFLLKLTVDTEHGNEKGRTALMIASNNGREKVVQTLVSTGTNVNIQDNEGRTALITAYEHDYVAIVDNLIQTGANQKFTNLKRLNCPNVGKFLWLFKYYKSVT